MFISVSHKSNERALLTGINDHFDARPVMMHLCASAALPIRRHDIDRKNPRTPKNIYDLNRATANRMEEVFLSRGIPVVPTIGERPELPLCDLIGFD